MDPNKISVVEKFISIQGEGRNVGVPYAFVRVGGCPLRCNFCDSEYTFRPKFDSIVSVDSIIEWIIEQDIKWVSITGGEPLVYPVQLKKILKELSNRFYFHIETSGRYYDRDCHKMSDLWSPDIKTPCTGEQDDKWKEWIEYLRPCDQVKFIIAHENDLEYASKILWQIPYGCKIVFQPFNELTDLAINPESTLAKRHMLLEKTKWLTERVLKLRWKNVIITPQLHVLLWGNKAGT